LLAPSAYLIAAAVGVAFALNAHRPFARTGRLSVSAFFAGWLTAELPLWHIVWQLVATAGFVAAGALAAWPGWLGLALAVVSWALLADLFVRARKARDIIERALEEALGDGYRARFARAFRGLLDDDPTLQDLVLPVIAARKRVERIPDLSYGPYGRRNYLDVYRQRGASAVKGGERACPVFLNVHGGAWILGDKERQAMPLIHHLASLGWVCVSINYRLSPRSTFPDHIVDVKRALAWVKDNIAAYGGDPAFVVVSGGSAGGHLASLAALTPGDPELQPGFEHADASVRACVPFYGVYDFTNRMGVGHAGLVGLLERLVMKRRLVEARDAFDRASPMSRVHAGAPPFLVVHGTNDSLVPVAQARLFVDTLRKASCAPVAYVELPQAQHAFEVFTSVRTAYVVRGVARFLGVVYGDFLKRREET
jgi:acetyl esterase/lipase